jgi:hypothetical protein
MTGRMALGATVIRPLAAVAGTEVWIGKDRRGGNRQSSRGEGQGQHLPTHGNLLDALIAPMGLPAKPYSEPPLLAEPRKVAPAFAPVSRRGERDPALGKDWRLAVQAPLGVAQPTLLPQSTSSRRTRRRRHPLGEAASVSAILLECCSNEYGGTENAALPYGQAGGFHRGDA